MSRENEARFLGALLAAIGLGERRGGVGGRTAIAPVRRGSRKADARRARRRARHQRALGTGGACPVDWRNPLMIGNRSNRQFAERHGLAALQDRIVARAEKVVR